MVTVFHCCTYVCVCICVCICVHVNAFTILNLSFICPIEICTCVSLLCFMWVCLCASVFSVRFYFMLQCSPTGLHHAGISVFWSSGSRGGPTGVSSAAFPWRHARYAIVLRFLVICNQIQGRFGSPSWCWVCLYAVDVSLTGVLSKTG